MARREKKEIENSKYTCKITLDDLDTLEIEYYKFHYENKLSKEELNLRCSNADHTLMEKSKEGNTAMYRLKEGKSFGVTYRFGRILKMFLQQSPDIGTLVELDCFDYLLTILRKLGYDGCFQNKTGGFDGKFKGLKFTPKMESKINKETQEEELVPKGKDTPGHQYYANRDGAAIFWKIEKLQQEQPRFDPKKEPKVTNEHSKHKNDTRELNNRNSRHHQIFLDQGQVSQVAMDMLFTVKHSDGSSDDKCQQVAIITGHFKSGKLPKDEPKKTNIVKMVVERIQYLRENVKVPVIMSADANTDQSTATYKAFHEALRKSKCPMRSAYDNGKEENPSSIKLRSHGSQVHKIEDKVEVTMIDYIFSTSDIVASRVMWMDGGKNKKGNQIPFAKKMLQDYPGGAPNPRMPSDHIPIGLEFRFIPQDSKWMKNAFGGAREVKREVQLDCGSPAFTEGCVVNYVKRKLMVTTPKGKMVEVFHKDCIRKTSCKRNPIKRGLWRTKTAEAVYITIKKTQSLNRKVFNKKVKALCYVDTTGNFFKIKTLESNEETVKQLFDGEYHQGIMSVNVAKKWNLRKESDHAYSLSWKGFRYLITVNDNETDFFEKFGSLSKCAHGNHRRLNTVLRFTH